jgi:trigger factor
VKVLSVRREPGSTAVLEIEIPEDRVARAVAQGLARVSQRARIPGFRPGKAPRAVVERYVGRDAVYEEALDRLLPEVYREAVQAAGIRPIGRPRFDETRIEEGKPLRLVARVEVEPEVRLGDYRTLRVPFEEPPVPDEEVDKTLEALRARYAQLLPKQGPAARGDFVLVRVLDAPEGEQRFARDRELLLEVGGQETPEELSQALEGRTTGDEVEWAGKESGPVRVRVVDVRVRELPALDDAFAQTVSDRQTLEELRAELRARIHEQAQARARAEYEEQVLAAVVEASEVELPETLVHGEVHELLEDLVAELRRRGLTWERYLQLTGKTPEQVHDDFRPRAEARVRARLVLDAVARAEGLEPPEEEVAQAIQNLAEEAGRTEEEIRSLFERTGRMEALRASLRRRRAARFLVATASEGRIGGPEQPQEQEGGQP